MSSSNKGLILAGLEVGTDAFDTDTLAKETFVENSGNCQNYNTFLKQSTIETDTPYSESSGIALSQLSIPYGSSFSGTSTDGSFCQEPEDAPGRTEIDPSCNDKEDKEDAWTIPARLSRQATPENWPVWSGSDEMGGTSAAFQQNTAVPHLCHPHGMLLNAEPFEDSSGAMMVVSSGYPVRTPLRGAGSAFVPGKWKDGEGHDVYTVMLRNIPMHVSLKELLIALNDQGFTGSYDFVYMPFNIQNRINRGFAFINFRSPGLAGFFIMRFRGSKWTGFPESKRLGVVPAAVQGFDANYAAVSKTRLLHSLLEEGSLFVAQEKDEAGHAADPFAVEMKEPLQDAQARAEKDAFYMRNAVNSALSCGICGSSVESNFKFCQRCGNCVQI